VRSRFDRVVIDSPPLVAVTDGAIISKLVDGCVFVVRAGKTDKHVAKQGVRALRDVSGQVAGAVLNAVNFGKHEYSRYYQYYAYRQDGYSPIDDGSHDGDGPTKGGDVDGAAAAGTLN
jgi:Mrp family chromosome partitioning ATPase